MADGREAKLGALYAPWDRHNQPFSAPRKHPETEVPRSARAGRQVHLGDDPGCPSVPVITGHRHDRPGCQRGGWDVRGDQEADLAGPEYPGGRIPGRDGAPDDERRGVGRAWAKGRWIWPGCRPAAFRCVDERCGPFLSDLRPRRHTRPRQGSSIRSVKPCTHGGRLIYVVAAVTS